MATGVLNADSIHKVVLSGGIKVALSDSQVEITSLVAGKTYILTAIGGHALVRQSTTGASSANAGFDICIPDGGMIKILAIDTVYNFVEADTTSEATAAVYISEVDENV